MSVQLAHVGEELPYFFVVSMGGSTPDAVCCELDYLPPKICMTPWIRFAKNVPTT